MASIAPPIYRYINNKLPIANVSSKRSNEVVTSCYTTVKNTLPGTVLDIQIIIFSLLHAQYAAKGVSFFKSKSTSGTVQVLE
jgi:hypothetical protein